MNRKKLNSPSTSTMSCVIGSNQSKFPAGEFSFSMLPFIHTPHHEFNPVSNWNVPPTQDYSQACEIGREYAAHFAQYLQDNPDMSGTNLLGVIARDIDFRDTSDAAGYWVGFFSQLERIICTKAEPA